MGAQGSHGSECPPPDLQCWAQLPCRCPACPASAPPPEPSREVTVPAACGHSAHSPLRAAPSWPCYFMNPAHLDPHPPSPRVATLLSPPARVCISCLLMWSLHRRAGTSSAEIVGAPCAPVPAPQWVETPAPSTSWAPLGPCRQQDHRTV